MSDIPSDLTPKMRTMSLTQVNQAGEPTEEEEMEDLDGTLLLDFMLENEPFEVLLAQYFPKKELDHRPPIFEYGVALTEAQLVEYARKHGLATDQLDSPHPDWSTIFCAIRSKLDQQLKDSRRNPVMGPTLHKEQEVDPSLSALHELQHENPSGQSSRSCSATRKGIRRAGEMVYELSD
ncbi:hypothetical protein PM082_011931 [Marasmius tenuissimus]|nr:hypothetical protein PM082_011931 [Marasmius tenuissimus]